MTVEQFRQKYEIAMRESRSRIDSLLEEAAPELMGSDSQSRREDFLRGLTVRGSSVERVSQVRHIWEGWLPESIEAFMRLAGEDRGSIDIGVDCRTRSLLDARAAYREWRREVALHKPDWFDPLLFEVPTQARFLGHHGGGTFYFFLENEADPPVWQLEEGAVGPRRSRNGVFPIGTRFSDLVVTAIERVPNRVQTRLRRPRY